MVAADGQPETGANGAARAASVAPAGASAASVPAPGGARARPPRETSYRWGVGLAGLGLVAGLAVALWPLAPLDGGAALLVGVLVVTDVLLLLPVDRDRAGRSFVSFAGAFVYVAFLEYGALVAAGAHALALGLGALVPAHWRSTPFSRAPASLVFNAGQLALAALAGGAAARLTHGVPLDGPATDRPEALVPFAVAYFAANTVLLAGLAWARGGTPAALARLGGGATGWVAFGLLVALPLALSVEALAARVGLALSVGLVFACLVAVGRLIDLNARLRERAAELARATAELRTLNAIGQTLSATLEPDRLFAELDVQVRRVLAVDAFLVALTDRGAGTLRFPYQVHRGVRQPPRVEDLADGDGILARAVRAGAPVLGDDTESFPLVGGVGAAEGRGRRGRVGVVASPPSARRFEAALAVPLLTDGVAIGALCVKSRRPGAYGPAQVVLLTTIAAQAAVAIRNAELFASERVALRAKEDFLASVSHELRTPITSISGYAQLLGRRLAKEATDPDRPPRPADHLAMAEAIADRARHLAGLVDELLEVSERGAVPPPSAATPAPEPPPPVPVGARLVGRGGPGS